MPCSGENTDCDNRGKHRGWQNKLFSFAQCPLAGIGGYRLFGLAASSCLSLGGPTGYAMNPARDFGPCLAYVLLPVAGKGKSSWGYTPITIVALLIGGAIMFRY